MELTFPKSRRLQSPAEFRRVYDAKKSVGDKTLVVYSLPNDLGHPRLGLSVSKKVGNAVARNRWKRLLREAFRLKQHQLPAADLVVIPKPDSEPNLENIIASLATLLRRKL